MIKHYFKIAVRSLAKQKGLAMINIFGLSIGLSCFLLFLLYSVNEFSFDRFHSNADNIYRVYRWTEAFNGEEAQGDTYMPMPLGPALKQELPDVQEFVRMREGWGENFIKADNRILRGAVNFADPQFLKVFSFPLVSGDRNTALKDPRSIILTEKTARKFFGKANPIGQTIEIKVEETFEPFTVTAIAKNIPSNSTVEFEMLGNYEFLYSTQSGKRSMDNWFRSSYQTYVMLKPGSRLPAEGSKMRAFRKKFYPGEEAEMKKAGWKGTNAAVRYELQPLRAMHTNTKVWGGSIPPVEPRTIWILISIAAGVLLIACINFTTLAIGRSAGRAKEVGIRKVVGSRRKHILIQFLMEAFLLTFLSTALGLLLVNFLLPYFNNLSGRELEFSFGYYPELIWLIIGLMLVVGLVAGSYPSVVLSRFNPIEVLKRKMKVGGSNFFTKSLVTVQFVLSVGLIISTMVIMQQLNFLRSRNPGFNKDNIIVVDAEGTDSHEIYPLFKQQLLQQPQIAGIAGSELGLGEGTGWSRSGFEHNGKHKDVFEYYVDHDYLKVMGMQLLAGRNFNPSITSDTVNAVIVNESMVRDFGWTIENAVGQKLKGYQESLTPEVIGVVKNFHYRPFSEEVLPQMFHQFSSYRPVRFFVRIHEGDPSKALAVIQSTWKKIVPDYPFKYSFLDDDLNRFYQSEERWSGIVGWAGGISIFLACLGLLGLASLSVVNRTKEIGIRKVLGATVSGIIGLLSKDLMKLVAIAFVIASPLAWYVMNKWLQDFAYRTEITFWIFIVAGIAAVAIALATVSLQALKAALMNPVKSLRTE